LNKIVKYKKIRNENLHPYKPIIEHTVYKSGIVKRGTLNPANQPMPEKPQDKNIVLQYTYLAVFKGGVKVYGTSFDMNKYAFSEADSKKMAYFNLKKNVSATFDEHHYSEQRGYEIMLMNNPRIYAGWTTYAKT
jgi:hypothetical protein